MIEPLEYKNENDWSKKSHNFSKEAPGNGLHFLNDLMQLSKTIASNQSNPEQIFSILLATYQNLIDEYEWYSNLYLNAPVGYLVVDQNSQIKKINSVACNVLQNKSENLINKKFSQFIPQEFQGKFIYFLKSLKAGKGNGGITIHLNINQSPVEVKIFGISGMETEVENQSFRLVFIDCADVDELEDDAGTEPEQKDMSYSLEKASENNLTSEADKTDNILSGLTILVADDDEVTHIYLSKLFEGKCKKMLFANNGKQAVELFQSNPGIDLILMDIKMPVMDGYSATIKIKELSKQVVVVAQTAYALASDREKALAAGCDDYLAKPLMKKDLFSVIVKFFN
jgi:CheY-like chemotaxis protein